MTATFNRRMRKTARTVVWEGLGAQSPSPDPIVIAIAQDSRLSLLAVSCSSTQSRGFAC
jgi:hypothetical protein